QWLGGRPLRRPGRDVTGSRSRSAPPVEGGSMTVPDQGRPDPPPPPAWLDVTIRVAGWVFAVWGAVASAVLEAFLTPLRFHGYRMPLSLLLAAVLNAGLVVFAYRVTGRRAAVVASALA